MDTLRVPSIALPWRSLAALWMVALLIELALCLMQTRGTLVFGLDDPYIHIDVAKQIRHLHYGFNEGEFSSPSSSIVWPFILAITPVPTGWLPYAALAYNFLSFIALARVLALLFEGVLLPGIGWLSLAIGWAIADNMAVSGLIGMEHGLQTLLGCCCLLALRYLAERRSSRPWLCWAVALSPLIRYEMLAAVLPIWAYAAFLPGRSRYLIPAAASIAVIVLFSLFISSHQMGYLPTSVLAHSRALDTVPTLHSVIHGIRNTLYHPNFGPLLFLSVATMLAAVLSFSAAPFMYADVAVLGVVAGHLLLGQYGLLDRYIGCIGGYLAFWASYRFLTVDVPSFDMPRTLPLARCLLAMLTGPIALAGMIPQRDHWRDVVYASANIYQQQYQMSRFSSEQWNRPIGVNDIGLVGFTSSSYVLDYWGLANYESFKDYKNPFPAPEHRWWMRDLAKRHNVDLAILYIGAFWGSIPPEWVQVGRMTMNSPRVTPCVSDVVFLATSHAAVGAVRKALLNFAPEVRGLDKLEIVDESGQYRTVVEGESGPTVLDPVLSMMVRK